MRPSVVVSLLLLSFLLQQAQGIRLEKGFKQVGAQKVQAEKSPSKEKSNDGGVLGEAILCKEGTMEKRVSKSVSKKFSHHWLPSIHEDYYGPRNHKPKHH
ncbi:hypothetical protein POTOM_024887 [Populus tomentosa]|uniref:Uncharacterized protein n=1 Tax=Populus tomentosa TaxID=118781 RepID=A0A8X8CWX0_POPTO|nr:hypothetical protein POTOM_024887 [Populus tomentosa]